MTSRQLSMFAVEDLPLFSLTAPRGPLAQVAVQIEPGEQLPVECEFCRATRLVGLCLFGDASCCWQEEAQPWDPARAAGHLVGVGSELPASGAGIPSAAGVHRGLFPSYRTPGGQAGGAW